MHCVRATALRKRGEDPADGPGRETMKETEFSDGWRSSLADFKDREASWQALRAQVQLPGAVD